MMCVGAIYITYNRRHFYSMLEPCRAFVMFSFTLTHINVHMDIYYFVCMADLKLIKTSLIFRNVHFVACMIGHYRND